MRAPYELWIAVRYLRARGREVFISLTTWLGIGGVTVGVAALIVVLSVMTGFEEALRERILGANPHVLVYSVGGTLIDYEPILTATRDTKGVVEASPFVMEQVMVMAGGKAHGAVLRSLPPISRETEGGVGKLIVEGEIADREGNKPNLVAGRELARTLGLSVGSAIQVLSPSGGRGLSGFAPRTRTFRVSGIFASGLYDYDANFAFASLESVRDFLGLGGRVGGIQVRIENPLEAREVAHAIQRRLGPGYWTRNWIENNRNLFAALKLQKATMAVILALIVLVAAFNVASSLIMAVMEKTSEIGVLKSMGATNRSIRRVFAFQGLLVGAVGAAAGLALGGLLCWILRRFPFIKIPGDVYFIDTLPVAAKPGVFALVALGSIGLCLLGALYPSWQASRLDPVETLRND